MALLPQQGRHGWSAFADHDEKAPTFTPAGISHDPGLSDLAIAATAQCHGLVVLTRNLRHFRTVGVAAADPSVTLPDPDRPPPDQQARG